MWSGPRNLSTAMMRSWENRSDTVVVDEPFYAHYLQTTGAPHPMAEEIIEHYDTNWQRVARALSTPPTQGVFYQKHITTHMLPNIALDWMSGLHHVFLIRDPRRVVASFSEKYSNTQENDLGYERQHQLFEHVQHVNGSAPIVVDANRFLKNPQRQLSMICERVGIAFDNQMLEWPAGERDSDGIWHVHWYDAVKRSTAFQPPPKALPKLNEWQAAMANECMQYYDALLAIALDE